MADKLRSSPTISTPTQLANERNVSITSDVAYDMGASVSASTTNYMLGLDGHPVHSPAVDRQSCIDVATGVIHEWYDNTWH